MRFDLEHLTRMRATAKEGFHGNYKDFESYWNSRIVERMDAPVPFAGYWDTVKLIKQAAWEEERINSSEGL